jgi:hypothetical protein
VEIRRITVGRQSREKFCETPSQLIAGCGGMCCHPSYMGSINRRIRVQVVPIPKK